MRALRLRPHLAWEVATMRRLLAIAAVPLALACASVVGEAFTIEDWAHKPIGSNGNLWKVTITNHTSSPLRCSVEYTWLDVDDFPLMDAFNQGTVPANSTADIGGQRYIGADNAGRIRGASATADCY
jgi:hypothetical protein